MLENLCLKITSSNQNIFDQREDPEALGHLPQMLGQMTGLRMLSLILIPAEHPSNKRCAARPAIVAIVAIVGTCYTYAQVFPRKGRWPHLTDLRLEGLAIDALDLWFFLRHQTPQVTRLSLYRIDLIESDWDDVIEILRQRGSWDEFVSLEGFLRNGDG